MINLLALVGLSALALSFGTQAQGQVSSGQSTYLIRGKLVRSAQDAITQLRYFMPKRQSEELRCQKFAIVLQNLIENNMDSFQVAEIGLSRSNKVNEKFKSLDVDGLRNLYINAIVSYLESDRVDAGLFELIECLSNKFRSFDAKARSFLNDAKLKAIVEQYKVISEQPVRMIQHPEEYKLMNLRFEDLDPVIKKELHKLHHGDERKISILFERKASKPAPAPKPVPTPPKAVATATAKASSEGPSSTVKADAVAIGGAPKQPTHSNETPKHVAPVQEPASAQGPTALDDESRRYFVKLFAIISKVYDTLPLTTKLPDRCHAYNAIIRADESELSQEGFIKNVASGLIKQAGPDDKVILPSDDDRENFLFALDYAEEFMAVNDPEALFDIQECGQKLA